ncbi:hypothetical protein [Nocardioides sp. CFH 31398]|uniref:hypothetical protein n=1 Tax=Nocardioides sp. CFH 31398 TaxID=2919579 RepID=UPI001F060739|nr:hypothetical protein [Nocardioides sp. CFH 31398]MCH1867562.1 hypothetical protein [Nocardioides sp. CFH 31398]
MTRAPHVVALVALAVWLGQVDGTSAAFTDRAVVTSGTHTSGSMAAPAVPTVTQVRGSGATRVAWTASAVGDHGATATSYEVQRYDAATGATPTAVCSVTADPGATLACEDGTRPSGTRHYAVRARFGASWRAESSRRAFAADLTGPDVTVTQPENGYRGSAADLRRALDRGCGADALGCGSAADPAGVEAVRWVLELRPSAGNRALRCWDGASFVVAGASGCADRAAATSAVSGGLRWRIPGAANEVYRDRGTYTVTVTARDVFANPTTVTSAVTVN